MFHCWILSFSYANTHCIENHYIVSVVEWSLTLQVSSPFLRNCSISFVLRFVMSRLFSQCPVRYSNCCAVLAVKETNVCAFVDCRSVNVRESIDDVTATGTTLEEHDRNPKLLLDDAFICNVTLNDCSPQHCVTTFDVVGQSFHVNVWKPRHRFAVYWSERFKEIMFSCVTWEAACQEVMPQGMLLKRTEFIHNLQMFHAISILQHSLFCRCAARKSLLRAVCPKHAFLLHLKISAIVW